MGVKKGYIFEGYSGLGYKEVVHAGYFINILGLCLESGVVVAATIYDSRTNKIILELKDYNRKIDIDKGNLEERSQEFNLRVFW